jgi:(4-(4-[2-(gamma-L-glutamylamino)ethyl]phenoxymethyl)furan-2-yl)methanamine synthase
LADTFSSRAEGVAGLTGAALRELNPSRVVVYAGRAGFVTPADAVNHVADIASANWFASASVLGKRIGSSLLMDTGSTTTDIVPVVNGTVAAHGYTDAERLVKGELVYTGLVRSFLMATAEQVPFAGSWSTLIRENFSTMADVHRILGSLPDGADQMASADGRAKTIAASQARLARIVGRDAEDTDPSAWIALARYFVEKQIRAITDGGMLVLSRRELPASAPIVVAGIGADLLREVARRLSRECIDFDAFIDVSPGARPTVSAVAPAASVAILGAQAENFSGRRAGLAVP